MNNLEISNNNDVVEFLTNQYIYEFINGIEGKKHPVSDWIVEHINLPNIGDHLESPRMNSLYTHHGIYIGNKEVIHYAGLSDGLNSAPVEKISLSGFTDGNKYKTISHPHTKYSKEEIVERAYSRLNENNYTVIWNNCEHFVNWCIYDISRSNQVLDIAKNIPYKPIKFIASSIDIGQSILTFIDGGISKEKLFDDIKKVSLAMSSSALYSTFGTVVAGPIGGIAGATVGYIIGDLLHKSGLVAFGDSAIVKEAANKRQRAEKMCNEMIPLIQQSRENLENYMENYFKDRKLIFEKSFEELEISMQNDDSQVFLENLEKINNQYGKTLGNRAVEDILNDNKAPMLF